MKPTLKAIHICNSHEKMLKPKIAKEYGQRTKKNKNCSKFEREIYRSQ